MSDLLDEHGDIADPYRGFIAKSRYARWIDEYGRRETWTETVDRYINYMSTKIDMTDEVKEEARQAISEHEVMPSMRALMTAGEALERSNIAGYNCFGGSERFYTPNGLVTFGGTAGTEQVVMNGKGQWVTAEVKSFGIQTLNRVTFRPGHRLRTNVRHDVMVTADHRWITTNRGEVTDLTTGDEVAFVPAVESDFIAEAFVAGFGYGDGTLDSRGRGRIRLCGEKDAQWLSVFEECGNASFCSPPSYNGDTVITYRKGSMEDFKELPRDASPEYLASWFRGYLAADGHVKDGHISLASQSDEALDFVREIAPLAGYMVTGDNYSSVMETNFGTRKAPLRRLSFQKEEVFKVVAIEENVVEEEVFCAVVPDGADFVLENGIHTGNCSFVAMNHPRAFDEVLMILMSGTGVGFSAEKRYVRYLPEVPETIEPSDEVIVVEDSKEGWAMAFRRLVEALYAGKLPKWDLRQLRPEGARLKTFGGRSSGPQPLNDLFEFTVKTFADARGRKLSTIEVHNIVCKTGEIVVVGGVRRSALISLGSLDDELHRDAKSGEWWVDNPQLALANNSAVYHSKPSRKHFDEEWTALVNSGSGERGIFNLAGAKDHVPERRDETKIAGVNPCGEILLRDMGFCNLSEVIVRPEDTLDDLIRKITVATKIGTWQSTFTNFNYLRPEWQKNAEEERLLGVSLTGQMGHPVLNGSEGRQKLRKWLKELNHVAIMTNKKEARRIGIEQSKAVTTVKPSGTVSTLTNTSSGMHAWHDPYYIRRVRSSKSDPIGQFLIDSGVSYEEDVMNNKNWVFSFPFKAPEGAVTRSDMTAIEQLEIWLEYKTYYTEHNPSVTISVKDEEWEEVGNWVFENFDQITGVSFLPHSDHTYQQAPFETITSEKYDELLAETPDSLDWSRLSLYEYEDTTTGSQTLACTAGQCSVEDLLSSDSK